MEMEQETRKDAEEYHLIEYGSSIDDKDNGVLTCVKHMSQSLQCSSLESAPPNVRLFSGIRGEQSERVLFRASSLDFRRSYRAERWRNVASGPPRCQRTKHFDFEFHFVRVYFNLYINILILHFRTSLNTGTVP